MEDKLGFIFYIQLKTKIKQKGDIDRNALAWEYIIIRRRLGMY
jgi:hypothetical protein